MAEVREEDDGKVYCGGRIGRAWKKPVVEEDAVRGVEVRFMVGVEGGG